MSPERPSETTFFMLRVAELLADQPDAHFEHAEAFDSDEQRLTIYVGERTLELKGDSRGQLLARLEQALEGLRDAGDER